MYLFANKKKNIGIFFTGKIFEYLYINLMKYLF